MKLLVTGSAGFIGKRAVEAALSRGWEVSSLDVRHPSENKRMDVRLLSRIDADVVLHLAGWASNADFADRLVENYGNNVMGMWRVLQLAAQSGARVVYASSSAVYANQADGDEYNVEDSPLDCREIVSHYAKSKLMCEMMADSFSHYAKSKLMCEMMADSFEVLGLKTLGLRIFNAYGPGDELKRHPSPISQMIVEKRRGRPWVCYGDGAQAKDFIHVDDVVEIIMRLIESDYEAATGIVNVGTGVATTFNALAQLIGVQLEYEPVPDPASYQYFTRADCTRLESIIGKYECRSVGAGIEGLL